MRDILFRGKRTDNGGWVEGWYCKYPFGRWPLRHAIIPSDDAEDGYHTFVEINPDTVCEWTGLTDKNGKRIFDGDIVANPNYPDEPCPVIYKPGYFAIRGLWDAALCDHNKQVEVVGNIYDNPDLIDR